VRRIIRGGQSRREHGVITRALGFVPQARGENPDQRIEPEQNSNDVGPELNRWCDENLNPR